MWDKGVILWSEVVPGMARLGQLRRLNRGDGKRMTAREGPDRDPCPDDPNVPNGVAP